MKTALSLVVLSLFVSACSDGSEGVDTPVSTETEEIWRGRLVPESGHGAPDTSVVKLDFGSGASPRYCSAMKFDGNTFWTAASCIRNIAVGSTVKMTNRVDGAFSGTGSYTPTIQAVHEHPTEKNAMLSPSFGSNTTYYDVGKFHVDLPTPNIPAYSAYASVHPDPVGAGQAITFTGYGLDTSGGSNSGKKQYAHFTTISALDYQGQTGRSASVSNGLYAQNMLTGISSSLPQSAQGDEGAPVFQKIGTLWKVVGIVASMSMQSETRLSRTGNVRNWLANPAVNQFQAGFSGFLFNRVTGRCITYAGLDQVTDDHCDQRVHDMSGWRLGTWTWANGDIDPNGFQLINLKSPTSCLDVVWVNNVPRMALKPCVVPSSTPSQSQRWLFETATHPDYRRLRNGSLPGCFLPSNSPAFPVQGVACSTANPSWNEWVMTRD